MTEATRANAVVRMKLAITNIDKGFDKLVEAIAILDEDTPEGEKVSSILNDFENLMCDLKVLRAKIERGC